MSICVYKIVIVRFLTDVGEVLGPGHQIVQIRCNRFSRASTGRFENAQSAPRIVIPPRLVHTENTERRAKKAASPNCRLNSAAQRGCTIVKPPVSACKPLCAILLRKPSVYPLSPVKANVGHLCEKLKSRMKNGLRWNLRR